MLSSEHVVTAVPCIDPIAALLGRAAPRMSVGYMHHSSYFRLRYPILHQVFTSLIFLDAKNKTGKDSQSIAVAETMGKTSHAHEGPCGKVLFLPSVHHHQTWDSDHLELWFPLFLCYLSSLLGLWLSHQVYSIQN